MPIVPFCSSVMHYSTCSAAYHVAYVADHSNFCSCTKLSSSCANSTLRRIAQKPAFAAVQHVQRIALALQTLEIIIAEDGFDLSTASVPKTSPESKVIQGQRSCRIWRLDD